MNNTTKDIDILCVGEILIDFIGHQQDVLINKTSDYRRYLGGSPTNVAINTARLGLRPMLISTIGNDGFGEYIIKKLTEVSVSVEGIKKINRQPTSVIFVSKSQGTPDFIPFRAADFCITEDQIPIEILQKSKIFHTTCFALSKNPAQTTILTKAKEAFDYQLTLSLW